MSNGTPVPNPGWKDIAVIFAPYISPMLWRLDLGSYQDVRDNAGLIMDRINGGGMPPLPYSPLTEAQVKTFANWIFHGCPLDPPPPTADPQAIHQFGGVRKGQPAKFP